MTAPDPNTARHTPGPPDPAGPRERLFLVARCVEDGRYLLVRRQGAHTLTLLSSEPPSRAEGLTDCVASLIGTHLGVRMRGEPRLSATRHPVHALHPYTGGQSTAYLRVVAVEVAGDPKADTLYTGLEALPLDDATRAVGTDVEQALLRDGAALLGDR